MRARQAPWLSRDNARAALSNARTNSRQIQHTTINLDRRLAQHREGTGARILAAAAARGIGFDVVRTWPGGRDVERQLKRLRNAPRLCPTCAGGGR
jgi:hypothetical protein